MRRSIKIILLIMALLVVAICASACRTSHKTLAAPTNLRIDNRVLKWDEVAHASEYVVSYGNEEHITKECRYELYSLSEAGIYTFEIMAISEGSRYDNSGWSKVTVNLPEIVKQGYDKAGFKYSYVQEIGGYEVSRGTADLSGEITIADSYQEMPVRRIAAMAFYNDPSPSDWQRTPDFHSEEYCNKVTTGVQLPSTIESIGNMAFACMVRLRQIALPESVKEIENGAFYGTTNMRRVVLPNGLKNIPDNCFANSGLKELTISDNVETIGEMAFYCETTNYGEHISSDLSIVTFPQSIRSIGAYAFAGRENLKTINFENWEGIDSLEGGVFDNTLWYKLQSDGMVYLENMLYRYKGELTEGSEVVVPSWVTCIGHGAFQGQKNLVKIIIPMGVKLMGESIFSSCTSLQEVVLPMDLEIIPNLTFSGAINLKSIILPDNLKEIGTYAFGGTGLESVAIPKSVVSVGDFSNCPFLKTGIFHAESGFMPFANSDALETLYYVGDEIQWEKMRIDEIKATMTTKGWSEGYATEVLASELAKFNSHATVYYYSENKPTQTGNYWRYVDGQPTKW